MNLLQRNLCTCPQCRAEASESSTLIEVMQYQNAQGVWVRWTRCSICHATSRQVYDYEAHRFGHTTLINRSVV